MLCSLSILLSGLARERCCWSSVYKADINQHTKTTAPLQAESVNLNSVTGFFLLYHSRKPSLSLPPPPPSCWPKLPPTSHTFCFWQYLGHSHQEKLGDLLFPSPLCYQSDWYGSEGRGKKHLKPTNLLNGITYDLVALKKWAEYIFGIF